MAYSVDEDSTGGYTGTTTGYAGVAETTATERATITHTATQTVGGSNSFTLIGRGVDTSTETTTANGVTGVTASVGTGTDVYTLTETGMATGGGYTQTVTGTDSYAESSAGNSQAGTGSGTVTGGGAWSRTSAGSGSTLASGSGTNAYTHTTNANELSGVFGQTLSGQTRYQLVQRFIDVSNAEGGNSPGHAKFSSHGLPFRDPPDDTSPPGLIRKLPPRPVPDAPAALESWRRVVRDKRWKDLEHEQSLIRREKAALSKLFHGRSPKSLTKEEDAREQYLLDRELVVNRLL